MKSLSRIFRFSGVAFLNLAPWLIVLYLFPDWIQNLEQWFDWSALVMMALMAFLALEIHAWTVVVNQDQIKRTIAIIKVWRWTKIWWPAMRLDEQKIVAINKFLRFLGDEAKKVDATNQAQAKILDQFKEQKGEAYHFTKWDDDVHLKFIRDFGKATVSASRLAKAFQGKIDVFARAGIPFAGFSNVKDFSWWLKVEKEDFDMSGDESPIVSRL